MTTLYRFYDDDNQLLYVGITDRGPRRWREHMAEKEWWDEVATVKLEKRPTRKAALKAEVAAIRRERPIYNIAHSRRRKAKPQRSSEATEWEVLPVEVPVNCDCRDCLRTIRGVLRRHPGSVPTVIKFFDRRVQDAGLPTVVRHPALFGELKTADLHPTPDKSDAFRNLTLTLLEFPHIYGGTVDQYTSALIRAGFTVKNPGLLKAAVGSIRQRVST